MTVKIQYAFVACGPSVSRSMLRTAMSACGIGVVHRYGQPVHASFANSLTLQ